VCVFLDDTVCSGVGIGIMPSQVKHHYLFVCWLTVKLSCFNYTNSHLNIVTIKLDQTVLANCQAEQAFHCQLTNVVKSRDVKIIKTC